MQLRKEGQKELLNEPISVFHVVVFGTDNTVEHFKKSNFSNKFEQELVGSYNYSIKKTSLFFRTYNGV